MLRRRKTSSKMFDSLDQHEMDCAIIELHDDLEHERDRRYTLADYVQMKRKDHAADRAKDRADYAFAQLPVKRDFRSFVDEMPTGRRKISQLSKEITSLRDPTDRLERERKNLMEVLKRGDIFIVERGLVLTVRAETSHVKHIMGKQPSRQLNHYALPCWRSKRKGPMN